MSVAYSSCLPPLRIGDAIDIYGMTPRAIRYYEHVGLVHAHRDRLNIRYYDDVARERLWWISRLRRAKVSLAVIRRVLAASTAEARARAAEKVLADRRRELLAAVRGLDDLIAEIAPQAQ